MYMWTHRWNEEDINAIKDDSSKKMIMDARSSVLRRSHNSRSDEIIAKVPADPVRFTLDVVAHTVCLIEKITDKTKRIFKYMVAKRMAHFIANHVAVRELMSHYDSYGYEPYNNNVDNTLCEIALGVVELILENKHAATTEKKDAKDSWSSARLNELVIFKLISPDVSIVPKWIVEILAQEWNRLSDLLQYDDHFHLSDNDKWRLVLLFYCAIMVEIPGVDPRLILS
jgi:hypothetical protein